MTVCIAGINHSGKRPTIITACDRKLSFFGGWMSAEGVAMKITGLNDDWAVMFSGDVSSMTALVDAIKDRTKKERPSTNFRSFARVCREAYMDERKPLIESEVLGEYDIDSYSEYAALRKSDPIFHEELTKEIKKAEEDWNLLFAGFDKQKHAHLFAIRECGKITFCDTEGFAAIGSGSLRALLALSAYPFTRNMPLSQAIFCVASAKFAAEGADGVGEETILSHLEPRQKLAPVFSDGLIDRLRKMWQLLPRFPKEAEVEIWRDLTVICGLIGAAHGKSTVRGTLSAAQATAPPIKQ